MNNVSRIRMDVFNVVQGFTSVALIDISSSEQFQRAHIRSAMSFPFERLQLLAKGWRVEDIAPKELQGRIRSATRIILTAIDPSPLDSARSLLAPCVRCPVDTFPDMPSFADSYPFLITRHGAADNTRLPNLVLPNLLIGNHRCLNPEVVTRMGIDLAISVASECPPPDGIGQTAHVPLDDVPTQVLGADFWTLANDVLKAVVAGRTVLIVCNMGISRSATLVIAVLLMLGRCRSVDSAWAELKQARPFVRPNEGFIAQLKQRFVGLAAEE
ncbi:Dual specificity phosphatase catalytic domain [Carpediemonas membranifera]|uniref:Dual specificity phosphatase catalytic domain n=1 Tax=Carpediemonas membranifera TaxID=201153 RepID=A0A8J6APM3_9EUKA|nr:Dual specificity phosphatase catalytic domain [Carpediemonas membranifera]|eukprot:KAG9390121.1 Dual specificity phosphatase catalytic domain [Carpediemonas membranifera]